MEAIGLHNTVEYNIIYFYCTKIAKIQTWHRTKIKGVKQLIIDKQFQL